MATKREDVAEVPAEHAGPILAAILNYAQAACIAALPVEGVRHLVAAAVRHELQAPGRPPGPVVTALPVVLLAVRMGMLDIIAQLPPGSCPLAVLSAVFDHPRNHALQGIRATMARMVSARLHGGWPQPLKRNGFEWWLLLNYLEGAPAVTPEKRDVLMWLPNPALVHIAQQAYDTLQGRLRMYGDKSAPVTRARCLRVAIQREMAGRRLLSGRRATWAATVVAVCRRAQVCSLGGAT
jgi:hypothetical protein